MPAKQRVPVTRTGTTLNLYQKYSGGSGDLLRKEHARRLEKEQRSSDVELEAMESDVEQGSEKAEELSLFEMYEAGEISARGCLGFCSSTLTETIIFSVMLMAFESFLLIIYGVWVDYVDDHHEAEEDLEKYPYFADINVMIYFGFGFLMTFLRRYGFSAIGYTLLFSSLAVQWSIPLGFVFRHDWSENEFEHRQGMGVESLLEGLFTAATVMISFGAVLGKVTPSQMLLMTFVEPIWYWVNYNIGAVHLEAVDIGGGMWIHTFGAYYGLGVAIVMTTKKARGSPENTSSYYSDVFSLAGTLFLWIFWPSFNGVLASNPLYKVRAIVNTFLSLTGATASTFLVSRWVGKGKIDVVHVQNATLAGGVAMGVAADLYLYPPVALLCGIIAGVISVLGYRFLTPFLARYLHIQDTCGVNNLHGMPGVFGAIIGIFATFGVSLNNDDDMPRGYYQPLYQLAALVITLIISIVSGVTTGILMRILGCFTPLLTVEYFNDLSFWESPADYGHVPRDPSEAAWLEAAIDNDRKLWAPEEANDVGNDVGKGKDCSPQLVVSSETFDDSSSDAFTSTDE